MRAIARRALCTPRIRVAPSRLRAAHTSTPGARLLLRRLYSTETVVPDKPAALPQGGSLQLSFEKLRGTKDDLILKIKGIFYGAALGDAIGRTVEGDKSELSDGVPPVLTPPGSWTSETEQLLLLADSLIAKNDLSPRDFASRLHQWSTKGLPGAPRPLPGAIHDTYLQKLLQSPNFASAPAATAKQVWNESDSIASSGALARSAVLAAVDMFDTPSVVRNSKSICLTTHPDPRCVAGSVLLSSFLGAVLRGGIRLGSSAIELRPVLQLSVGLAIQELETEKQIRELQQLMRATSLKDLKVADDPSHIYKALGSAIFALLNFKSFEEGVSRVALAGGNTPTNTAVTGALLGAHYGYYALPVEWLEAMSRNAEIESRVQGYLKALGL